MYDSKEIAGMKRVTKKAVQASSDVYPSDAWAAYEDLVDNFGADDVLEEFARYMSDNMLADYCGTYARYRDHDFYFNDDEDDEDDEY